MDVFYATVLGYVRKVTAGCFVKWIKVLSNVQLLIYALTSQWQHKVCTTTTNAVLHHANLLPFSYRYKDLSLRTSDDWVHLTPGEYRQLHFHKNVKHLFVEGDLRSSTTSFLFQLNLLPGYLKTVHIFDAPGPLPAPSGTFIATIPMTASAFVQHALAEQSVWLIGPTDL